MARMLPSTRPSTPSLDWKEPHAAEATTMTGDERRPVPSRAPPEMTAKASVDRIESAICITTVAAATLACLPPGQGIIPARPGLDAEDDMSPGWTQMG
ncbi:hypothetical protein ZHAS_00014671 [Anopheles sinensis]|uniref:Uncharacterized protein n=1 Tax=Anopheles sinensis TaxID=74873 RepID=A0A084W8T0_ANOSI|nr:hypothetical protein ZHAS_00014671 [Anopheles sinensis]